MTDNDTPAIEFVGVSKKFQGHQVIKDLSFSVREGEFVSFLGPSGCGKSTILKIICGIEDPTEGEIYVDGRLTNYLQPRDRGVAMVFQNYALYPHMTVRENIGYPLSTSAGRRDRPPGGAAGLVDEVARIAAIETQLDKYPDQLSGGQRQRVALARAIVRRPTAYLLDEPLSNLDAKLRDQMRAQLVELHRKIGKAMLYVTHDQVEAMSMSSRIVVLNEGVIQQQGPPAEIYRHPANTFVARFIGSPQMSIVEGVCTTPGQVRIGSLVLAHSMQGSPVGPVQVGLRPTDIKLAAPASANRFTADVVGVSYLGADSVADIAVGPGTRLLVRVDSEASVRTGDRLELAIAPERVHLFDARGTALPRLRRHASDTVSAVSGG